MTEFYGVKRNDNYSVGIMPSEDRKWLEQNGYKVFLRKEDANRYAMELRQLNKKERREKELNP